MARKQILIQLFGAFGVLCYGLGQNKVIEVFVVVLWVKYCAIPAAKSINDFVYGTNKRQTCVK